MKGKRINNHQLPAISDIADHSRDIKFISDGKVIRKNIITFESKKLKKT